MGYLDYQGLYGSGLTYALWHWISSRSYGPNRFEALAQVALTDPKVPCPRKNDTVSYQLFKKRASHRPLELPRCSGVFVCEGSSNYVNVQLTGDGGSEGLEEEFSGGW